MRECGACVCVRTYLGPGLEGDADCGQHGGRLVGRVHGLRRAPRRAALLLVPRLQVSLVVLRKWRQGWLRRLEIMLQLSCLIQVSKLCGPKGRQRNHVKSSRMCTGGSSCVFWAQLVCERVHVHASIVCVCACSGMVCVCGVHACVCLTCRKSVRVRM